MCDLLFVNPIFIWPLTAMAVMEALSEVVDFTKARLQPVCLSCILLTIKIKMPAFTKLLLK